MRFLLDKIENNQNKRMVIYTVILGDYDDLKIPSVVDDDCEYICLTDDFMLTSEFWKIVHVKDVMNLGNIRFNRFLKINPHLIFSMYEKSFYLDANLKIEKSIYLFLNEYSTGKLLLTFANFGCDCIYKAAEDLKAARRDHSDVIDKHIERLRADNYPEHNGMVAAGYLYREHNNTDVIKLMEEWWKCVSTGSRRDQLSFNYVCWKQGFDFDLCPLNWCGNEY